MRFLFNGIRSCSSGCPATVVALLFIGLMPESTFSQPPSGTCDANASLTGMDMLPLLESVSSPTNDFAMSGTCTEGGSDIVACLVPENSCSVTFQCNGGPAQFSANVFLGPCDTNQSSCVASSSDFAGTSLTVALTAGTEYCFECEASFMLIAFVLTEEGGSDCGSLPVELQQFSVSR